MHPGLKDLANDIFLIEITEAERANGRANMRLLLDAKYASGQSDCARRIRHMIEQRFGIAADDALTVRGIIP